MRSQRDTFLLRLSDHNHAFVESIFFRAKGILHVQDTHYLGVCGRMASPNDSPPFPPPAYDADHKRFVELDDMADGRSQANWSVVPPASRECRICFEKGGSSMFSLIAPCLCKGTC